MGREGTDLLGLLVGSGVPQRGARLYLAACQGGPRTASELARITALNRVEAYRIIQQLAAQGLLKETGGRPKRFVALEPDLLVDRWIRETADRLVVLQRDRESIVNGWREDGGPLTPVEGPTFTILEGKGAADRWLAKRIGTAQRQVLLTLTAPELAALMDGGVERALRSARDRGVRVRILTDIHRAHLAEIKHFLTFAEVRHAIAPLTQRSIVIDRAGALIYVLEDGSAELDASKRQLALWSQRPSVVDLSREYHQRLWTPSIRAENRLVAIETPNMTVLPIVAGRERDPFRQLRDITALGMRATGTKQLHLSVPELIEGIADQLGTQIAEEIEARTPAELGHVLASHHRDRGPGALDVVRERPLTLRIRSCFACTEGSTEIGRVMCPRVLSSVLENVLGGRWEVSKPDPTRHATRGCIFTVRAG